MDSCIQRLTKIVCRYKSLYLLVLVLTLTILLLYLDQTYTVMPKFKSRDLLQEETGYVEEWNETMHDENKSVKTILLWTNFFKSMYWESQIRQALRQCSRTCEVTSDRRRLPETDAVLFHHGDIHVKDFPTNRAHHQPWILFTMEPTTLIQGNLNWLAGRFNWTMSYRRYSTVFNPYGYYQNISKDHSTEQSDNFKIRNKTMMAVVSRCHDDARRYKLAHELEKHFKVDIYGACSPNNLQCNYHDKQYCLSPKETQKYKFRLAFENSHCRDYITEKYWSSLIQNVLPIVNWKEHQHNGNVIPNSYINIFDFDHFESAVQYIKDVDANETLYNSYFNWKQSYRPFNSVFTGFCRLCDKLHSSFKAQVYRDLHKWFDDDTCEKYNLFDGAMRHIDRYFFNKLQET